MRRERPQGTVRSTGAQRSPGQPGYPPNNQPTFAKKMLKLSDCIPKKGLATPETYYLEVNQQPTSVGNGDNFLFSNLLMFTFAEFCAASAAYLAFELGKAGAHWLWNRLR